MKRFNYIIFLISGLLLSSNLFSQNKVIQGYVLNTENTPIVYTAVILQTSNSEFIDAQLTDSTGLFRFSNTQFPAHSKLIFQHATYENDTLYCDKIDSLVFVHLKEKNYNLNEVVIVAERPQVKIKEDVFLYDFSQIAKENIVQNAYESLLTIPGIIEHNNEITLAGLSDLKITIDGQSSILSKEQLSTILKSISASKIKNIEVQYNAPAKYNTKGALINIVLKDNSNKQKFSSEINYSLSQSHYLTGTTGVSMTYNKDKFKLDYIVNIGKGKMRNESNSFTSHFIHNDYTSIEELTKTQSKDRSFNTRIHSIYKVNKDSRFISSMYIQSKKEYSLNNSQVSYQPIQSTITSQNKNQDKSLLGNVSFDYYKKKFNMGIEYLFYNNPTSIMYTDNDNTFTEYSKQKISKYSIYLNNDLYISSATINYGINWKHTHSHSYINYSNNNGNLLDEHNNLNRIQAENNLTAFAELKHNFSKKFLLRGSLKFDLFHSTFSEGNTKSTLWKDFTIYPNLTLSYKHSDNKNLQCVFYTNRRFPSYWAINPQTTHINSYMSIEGNPLLKPNKTFVGRLIYSYKKYSLISTIQYSPDYFMQIPHMDEDNLKLIYRYENYDYKLQLGLMFVIPIKWSKNLSSRITMNGINTKEKIENYYGSFLNNVFNEIHAGLNNSWKINTHWLFQTDFSYHSPSQQGTYKLSETINGSIKLKWKCSNQINVVFHYNNVFKRQMPSPMKIEYGKQYREIYNKEYSTVGFSFTWNLGNFNSTRFKNIDTQRLMKQ